MQGASSGINKAGDLHFVTLSCYHRLPHLGYASACEIFEHSLETIRLRYQLFVTGYVVMPEHVHLLASEPLVGTLAKALQALKLSVAVQRAERAGGPHLTLGAPYLAEMWDTGVDGWLRFRG